MSVAEAFASYGAERAPPQRRAYERAPFNGGVKVLSPLEAKLEERGRLARAHKAWKRAERRRLIEAEPRLLNLIRFLRHVQAGDADDLIEGVRECRWLQDADAPTRILALTLIQQRADRINLLLGLPVFSDPLPVSLQDPAQPPEASVYHECRRLLVSGGRL